MTYKEGTMLYHTIYQSPLGNISLLADDGGLLGAWFLEQKYFERGYEGAERSEQSNVILDSTKMWLDEYFSGKNPEIPDFLAAQGSQFQKNVFFSEQFHFQIGRIGSKRMFTMGLAITGIFGAE